MRTVTVPIIESDADHAVALARIDALWGSPEGSIEAAEMDLLVDLVRAYEERTDPWPDLPPREIVLGVMESHSLTASDLSSIFGSEEGLAEVLAGRREVTVAQAFRMRDAYHVPLELLLRSPLEGTP